MQDEAMAEELWRVSEDLTRNYLVSHERPDLNDFERAIPEKQSSKE